MGVIFVLSAQTALPRFILPAGQLLTDKGLHAFEYAILGALCYRAVVWTFSVEHPMLWSFTLSLAYAVSDELHQRFVPGRHSDLADLAADAAGVLLGLVVARFAMRWRFRVRLQNASGAGPVGEPTPDTAAMLIGQRDPEIADES